MVTGGGDLKVDISCTQINGIVIPSDQREALMHCARDTSDTAIAYCLPGDRRY